MVYYNIFHYIGPVERDLTGREEPLEEPSRHTRDDHERTNQQQQQQHQETPVVEEREVNDVERREEAVTERRKDEDEDEEGESGVKKGKIMIKENVGIFNPKQTPQGTALIKYKIPSTIFFPFRE